MAIDVGVWLYNISKCGYFPWRSTTNPGAHFGSTSQTFADLTAWATGKLLGQTSTFTPQDGDDLAEVYFLDIHKGAHGDFLIGVWNRLPGNQNNISSVGVGDKVGAASSAVTPTDVNRIPGYATYFWVMPAEGKIASIKLKHLSHGLNNFSNYIANFLRFINPQHVVLGPPGADGSIAVTGYRQSPAHQIVASGVRPLFSVKSLSLGGDLAFLRANATKIDRVFCKTILKIAEPRQYAWWQTVMDVTRVVRGPAPLVEEAPIRVEFPMTFDLDSLNATIDAWEDDLNDGKARANDIGFRLQDGQQKWLSRTQARSNFPVEVEWIDKELVNIEALLQQLQIHRAEVLALG